MIRRREKRPRSVLERKVRLLFGFTLLVLLSLSFYLANSRLESIIVDEHRRTARAAVAGIWLADHSVWREKDRPPGLSPSQGFDYILGSRQDYARTYFATGGRHSATPEDDFERHAVAALLQGRAREVTRLVTRDRIRSYQYLTVLPNLASCRECHDQGAPRSRETRGVISVRLQTIAADDPLSINRAVLLLAAAATAVVTLVLLYLIVRFVITRPVAHLKQVTDLVSRGDRAVRTTLRTGDELEDFGRAFNRMLDTIAATEAELRRVNASLDAKVEELGYANLALYELNRVKSQFVATMTHELRTPLNAIIGFSEVLRDEAADRLDHRHLRYLRNIRASGEHLLELINNILDLAKIESGRMELNLQRLSVGEVCRNLASSLEPLVTAKGLMLQVHVPEDLPPAVTDGGKLRQIVYNLLGNAVKFTPAGGRVDLTAAAQDGHLRIDVADTGIGIPPDQLPAIFERFRQVDGSASRAYDGSGLGLAIVAELVRLLHGTVSAVSEVGRGSTFTVVLPLEIPGHEGEGVVEVLLGDGLDFSKARRVYTNHARPSAVDEDADEEDQDQAP
jgi:two-component system sensor histidine kinase BarA